MSSKCVNISPVVLLQIIMEGIIGYNYTSDTAIDDLMLHAGPCGTTEAPTTTRPTYGKLSTLQNY